MTELLGLGEAGWPWHGRSPRVLDIGTGSGYQAAVLAQLGASVISVERDAGLAEAAAARLSRLGYPVEVIIADGGLGHAAAAPYAGIVVAAAAPRVPGPLVDQLCDGAVLVIPVGSRSSQLLTAVRRVGAGTETVTADACVFVPLMGSYGFSA
jgi:protein-L-isoaspartate(D-aspartate) O-methyltransferase